MGVYSLVVRYNFWSTSPMTMKFLLNMSNYGNQIPYFLNIKKNHFIFKNHLCLDVTGCGLGIFTTLWVPRFNDLELKLSWSICIVGKHVPKEIQNYSILCPLHQYKHHSHCAQFLNTEDGSWIILLVKSHHRQFFPNCQFWVFLKKNFPIFFFLFLFFFPIWNYSKSTNFHKILHFLSSPI